MTGGHGVCFDFPASRVLADLTAELFESGKVVSAVCHGPAGLLGVKVGGEYLVQRRAYGAAAHRRRRAGDVALQIRRENDLWHAKSPA